MVKLTHRVMRQLCSSSVCVCVICTFCPAELQPRSLPDLALRSTVFECHDTLPLAIVKTAYRALGSNEKNYIYIYCINTYIHIYTVYMCASITVSCNCRNTLGSMNVN